jgi:GNAT superfamily N-acetyltransferase
MIKDRARMKLVLKKQEVSHKNDIRNISNKDVHILGSLMLDAYKDTIDYDGESMDDAISEVQATLDGKYGPYLDKCSFLIEKDKKAISASIITLFDKVNNPLLAFLMTHPDYKNQGLGTYLLKLGINALLDDGYKELSLFVTEGNKPAQHLFNKMGFQETEEKQNKK